MFIYSEETPNPLSLKFTPSGSEFGISRSYSYESSGEAKDSKLAQLLFSLDDVRSVYLDNSFVTVTKSDEADWDNLKVLVIERIVSFFNSGEKAIEESEVGEAENSNDVEKKIIELLETRVRPAVAQDGGDIIFQKYEDGVVWLKMLGACSGCPSSTITLKNGIENMLCYYVPEVQEVRDVMELE